MKIVDAIIQEVVLEEDRFDDPAVNLVIHYDGVCRADILFSTEYSNKKDSASMSHDELTLPQAQLKKLMEYTGAKSHMDLKGKTFRALFSGGGGLSSNFLGFGHPTDNDFVLTKKPNLFEEVF